MLLGAECTVWKSTVTGTSDQGTDTIAGLRNHEEIEEEVRTVLKSVPAIQKVTYVRVDYLGGRVQVRQQLGKEGIVPGVVDCFVSRNRALLCVYKQNKLLSYRRTEAHLGPLTA